MKKVVYFLSLVFMISSMTFSQSLSTTVWEKSKAKSNYPKFMLDTTGSLTRAIAYGKIGGNDRFLVCTRNVASNIYIFNASTGDSVGKLNMTGVTGGTYPINDVEVSSDGVIFAANLSLGSGSDTAFVIYKWTSESATPVKAVSFKGPGRLGDKITVVGSTADNSIVIYAATAGSDKVVRLTTTDNGNTFTPQIISLSNGALGSSPSVGPVSVGISSDFYIKSIGKSLIRFNSNGVAQDTLSGGIVATGSSAVRAIVSGSNKYVAVYNYGAGNENIRFVDVSNGVPQARLVFTTTSLGSTSNANGTGDVAVKDNGDGTFDIFILGTNNGVACYRTRDLRGLSPFTVAMDGLNMFTEGCNLMQKGAIANHYFAYDNTYLYFGFYHPNFSLDTLDIRVWIDSNLNTNAGAVKASWGAPTFDSTVYKPNFSVFLENGFYSEVRKWTGADWSTDLGFVGSSDRFGGYSGNNYFSELRVRRDSLGNPSAIAYAVTMETEDNSAIYNSFPTENGNSNSVKYFYVIPNFNSGNCVRSYNTGIVPVELTSFTASALGKGIVLNWTTATEKNNNGFVIERSVDGKTFSSVKFVQGKGTTSEMSSYSYSDNTVTTGKYYYRLRQMDFDGTINYSKTVEASVSAMPYEFTLSQNYPNPFNPTTNIKFTVTKNAQASLIVYNSLGQQIATLFNANAQAGRVYDITFDASKLTSGVYFYQLRQGNSVDTHKMLLIK